MLLVHYYTSNEICCFSRTLRLVDLSNDISHNEYQVARDCHADEGASRNLFTLMNFERTARVIYASCSIVIRVQKPLSEGAQGPFMGKLCFDAII